MKIKKSSWNFLAIIFLVVYVLSQIRQWNVFPQHFDIYYHFLTAWGFIKAGGYSTWDFWQYAPIGRPNIYPPLFHIILAMFMKAGIGKIFLARLFSVALPALFLFTLWNFVKKNFGDRFAFLTLLVLSSSFSFYSSLINHMPSTLAMIFCLLSLEQIFKKRIIRAGLLLALSFYTHIGTSWFFMFGILIYILLNSENKREALLSLICGLAISMPILIQQILNIRLVSLFNFNELYFCEFKTIDYMLAAFGIVLSLKKEKKYRLFIALFIASFIYIKYPSRFFSAEGYLPIVFLSIVSINSLFENFAKGIHVKIMAIGIILFVSILSPTVVIKQAPRESSFYNIYLFDSTFMNMIFGEGKEKVLSRPIWLEAYTLTSKVIEDNSSPGDIIYCTEDSIGLSLAALSGRATANYLLPEVHSTKDADAMADSRLVLMLKYHSPEWVKNKVDRYGLKMIARTSILDVYSNPSATSHIQVKKALIPFNLILALFLFWLVMFFKFIY